MVALGFSEFTFAYAFLFEQTTRSWSGITAAPILPSLREEQDVGWDANLPTTGVDYYYQFKLAEYLSRRSAGFIRDGTYDGPYFRVALHRRDANRQHQRLKEHARTHPHTYYVAPELHNHAEFNDAFLNRGLSNVSRLIPLADCDEVTDEEQHYFTFQQGSPTWHFHSKKKRHSSSIMGSDLEKLFQDSRRDWKPLNEKFAIDLFERTRSNLLDQIDKEEKQRSLIPAAEASLALSTNARRGEIMQRTAQMLAAFSGVTLVIVGERG